MLRYPPRDDNILSYGGETVFPMIVESGIMIDVDIWTTTKKNVLISFYVHRQSSILRADLL